MCKMHKIISIALAFIMLMSMMSVSVFAAGICKNFSTYSETCTFDGEYTFGASGDYNIFAANTDKDDTIYIESETITAEDGTESTNKFLQITSTNSYPYVMMYYGSDAGTGDIFVKFDYYVNTTTKQKDRLSFNWGKELSAIFFDNGTLKVLGTNATTYSAGNWYNCEFYTDKATDSIKWRIKASDATEWNEGWVTSNGYFDAYEASTLGNIKFGSQYNATWTTRIDNYSHGHNTTERVDNRYKVFSRFEKVNTFDECSSPDDYMFHANVNDETKVTELVADPADETNTVFNMRDAGKKYLWIAPFYTGTGAADTLKVSFDFYDANGTGANEFIRLVTANSSNQPVITVFKNGKLIYGEEDSLPITDDNGEEFTYEANKWYSITFEANWYQNYLKMGFKEKDAAEYRYATMPFFAEFARNDVEGSLLTQLRIGYIKVNSDDVSFYIDNYSHSAAADAIPATADVTKALSPKSVITKVDEVNTVTGVQTHAMTLSGQDKTVKLLVALYDENGKLTKVKMTDDVTVNSAVGETVTLDLSAETFSTYKAYVWSALDALYPIDLVEASNW